VVAASPSKIFVTLGVAGIKRAKAWLRAADAVHPEWETRAEICQRCPLVVVQCRKSYCGKPLLRHLDRDEATDGCGCPVNLKARDPGEHCPRNVAWEASSKTDALTCDCTWCASLRSAQRSS
jgi:hypothetical protein